MSLKNTLATALTSLGCVAQATSLTAEPVTSINRPMIIKSINFKTCVEQSKTGKKEQANFDALKKQMETVLGEKEKALNEIASKLEDPDYRDSLSVEAETELNRKFRTLGNEFNQIQTQYYQALQQTNMKVVQKLQEAVSKAAHRYGKDNSYDLIVNEESCFFTNPSMDISPQIVVEMDKMFSEEEAKAKEEATQPVQLPTKAK